MQHLTFRILEILQNKNGIFFIIMTRVIPCMQLISWFAYSWIWWCQVDLEHSSVVILWSQLECPLNMEACSPNIIQKRSQKSIFLPCKGIWILESQIQENVQVESGILGLAVRNTAQGIRNPSSTNKNWKSRILNSVESKTQLDFLTWVSMQFGTQRLADTCIKLQVKHIWLIFWLHEVYDFLTRVWKSYRHSWIILWWLNC